MSWVPPSKDKRQKNKQVRVISFKVGRIYLKHKADGSWLKVSQDTNIFSNASSWEKAMLKRTGWGKVSFFFFFFFFFKELQFGKSSLLPLAQLWYWQSVTLEDDQSHLVPCGSVQVRISFLSYWGNRLTLSFTSHPPSLDVTWSGIGASPRRTAAPVNRDLFWLFRDHGGLLLRQVILEQWDWCMIAKFSR